LMVRRSRVWPPNVRNTKAREIDGGEVPSVASVTLSRTANSLRAH
jgi:hypothetical protein